MHPGQDHVGQRLADGGFYREVRIPNLSRGLHLGDALGPVYRHLDLDNDAPCSACRGAHAGGRDRGPLGRHPSTIHRELGRNRFRDGDRGFCGYFPLNAQALARRRRQRRRKPAADEGSRAHVTERLEAGWSPQRIAGRLRQEQGRSPRSATRPSTGTSTAPGSRGWLQLQLVAVEQPAAARFVTTDEPRELRRNTPIPPGGELAERREIKLPRDWKGVLVLRFDVASPVGGRVVRCPLRVPVGV